MDPSLLASVGWNTCTWERGKPLSPQEITIRCLLSDLSLVICYSPKTSSHCWYWNGRPLGRQVGPAVNLLKSQTPMNLSTQASLSLCGSWAKPSTRHADRSFPVPVGAKNMVSHFVHSGLAGCLSALAGTWYGDRWPGPPALPAAFI